MKKELYQVYSEYWTLDIVLLYEVKVKIPIIKLNRFLLNMITTIYVQFKILAKIILFFLPTNSITRVAGICAIVANK